MLQPQSCNFMNGPRISFVNKYIYVVVNFIEPFVEVHNIDNSLLTIAKLSVI